MTVHGWISFCNRSSSEDDSIFLRCAFSDRASDPCYLVTNDTLRQHINVFDNEPELKLAFNRWQNRSVVKHSHSARNSTLEVGIVDSVMAMFINSC